jgi:clan AA aspartic protease
MGVMGQFSVTFEIGDLLGREYETVEAPVDTGASNSMFPSSMLRRLGVQVDDRNVLQMADGRTREFDMGTVRVRLDGRERFSEVVFGEDDMRPILGAITLEEFHLAVDPVAKRLVRTEGLLASL